MFDFLKRKRPKPEPSFGADSLTVAPNSSQLHTNVQRELIRVVLKDTLRINGIPFGLMACEVIVIARGPGKDELHIHLIMMKWNDKLLRYACALERQLLLGLDRFDPSVDHSKYIISWRMSPTCGNPYSKMPPPKTWLETVNPQVTEEPVPVMDRRHARRSSEAPVLAQSLFDPYSGSSNFAPTDISPLR